jgi:hypothetical protein
MIVCYLFDKPECELFTTIWTTLQISFQYEANHLISGTSDFFGQTYGQELDSHNLIKPYKPGQPESFLKANMICCT